MTETNVTPILDDAARGEPQAAGRLLPLVYEELRKLAARRLARETPGQTLQATALVHEAYLRLVDTDGSRQRWGGRGHFFSAAAEAMRRILVDKARHKQSLKGGGGRRRADLGIELAADVPGDDVLALDEALERLGRDHPRKAELVKLRFFAGLTNDEAAEALGISASTVDNDWAYARCWLRAELEG
jgi:RNA polymerase sigma factor (TIGR02999 family)